MKTKQKKKPAPKPCEGWAIVNKKRPEVYVWAVYLTKEGAESKSTCFERVVRVRIVPVAAKRRKGGK